VTKIDTRALHGHPLSEFGVEEHLGWKDGGQCTQDEDRVYYLLGIFDISMPFVLGEGYDRAMKRFLREVEDSCEPMRKCTGEIYILLTW
jgi:hypothetical protein